MPSRAEECLHRHAKRTPGFLPSAARFLRAPVERGVALLISVRLFRLAEIQSDVPEGASLRAQRAQRADARRLLGSVRAGMSAGVAEQGRGGGDDATRAERARQALLLATQALGVSAAAVRAARAELESARAAVRWLVTWRVEDGFGDQIDYELCKAAKASFSFARPGTEVFDADVAGGSGIFRARAVNVRGAMLLATRALGSNADAVRMARERRDVARDILRRLTDSIIATLLVGTFDTLIIAAAREGMSDVVQLFLERGENPDATYDSGDSLEYLDLPDVCSALAVAAMRGHRECVEVLIKAGADTSRRDSNGATALQVAEENGHGDIAAMLRSAGSSSPSPSSSSADGR